MFYRSTLPELLPSNQLLNHTTALGRHTQSSFPVSVIQNRSTSPTKSIHGTSNPSSSSLGGRNPIHGMDCISEDLTENCTSPTSVSAHHSPPSPRTGGNRRSSLGAESSIKHLLNIRKNSTPVSVHSSTLSPTRAEEGAEKRQRRVGSAISPPLHARITATLANEQNQRRLSGEPTSSAALTAYLLRRRNSDQPTTSASNHQTLLSQLQMPTFNHQKSVPEMSIEAAMSIQNGLSQCYPEAIYTNGHNRLNHTTNTQLHSVTNHIQHPTLPNAHMSIEGILTHISSVLSSCGIPFQHNDGVFTLEHQGVQLQIVITSVPYSIQLRYVAGDTAQYETVCTQLYNRLQRYPSVIPQQKVYTTYVS